MIAQTFRLQAEKIKNNKATFLLLVALSVIVIWFGNFHDAGAGHKKAIQAVAYLFAMWLCSFCIDMYAAMKPAKDNFPVRRPVSESIIVFVFALIGAVSLLIRFAGKTHWDKEPVLYKLTIAAGLIFFIYPIALVIFLLVKRYRLKDIGIRFKGFIPAIAVIIITAAASWFAAGSFTIKEVIAEEGGIGGALMTGFVFAGLSEEIFRMAAQTRFGAALKNTGIGWLLASLAWALMHAPKWWGESGDLREALLSSLRIMPLGLMWGYLTHRTKSILPSVLAHGMNVWGLQNF